MGADITERREHAVEAPQGEWPEDQEWQVWRRNQSAQSREGSEQCEIEPSLVNVFWQVFFNEQNVEPMLLCCIFAVVVVPPVSSGQLCPALLLF